MVVGRAVGVGFTRVGMLVGLGVGGLVAVGDGLAGGVTVTVVGVTTTVGVACGSWVPGVPFGDPAAETAGVPRPATHRSPSMQVSTAGEKRNGLRMMSCDPSESGSVLDLPDCSPDDA